VAGLLGALLGLPVVILVILAFGWVLAGMGDEAGSAVLVRVGQGLGIVWILDLIGLVVVMAGSALMPRDEPPDELP
jgi:hypothetical protein